MDKKNFFIIQNSLKDECVNRSYQIALVLSQFHNVKILKVTDKLAEPEVMRKPIDVLLETKVVYITKDSNLEIINVPELNCFIKQKYKYYSTLLENIIEKYSIEIVLNSSFDCFSIPEKVLSKIIYIYDVSDDYLEIEHPIKKVFISDFIQEELNKADLPITSSKTLEKIYKKKYWVRLIYFPNGSFHPEKLNSNEKNLIKQKLYKKYNISDFNTKVISVINLPVLGRRLEMLIEAFLNLRRKINFSMKLFIATDCKIDEKYYNYKDIIIRKKLLPEETDEHFIFTDLGAAPLSKCRYIDCSLSSSIIEYGMFRKSVISTPTNELQLHNLPHIIFSNEKVESWETAILWGLQEEWHESWNKQVDRYDWNKIIIILERLIQREDKNKNIGCI